MKIERVFFNRPAVCLALITLLATILRVVGLSNAPLLHEEKWTLVQATGFSFIDPIAVGQTIDTAKVARWTGLREILHRIGAFDQPLFIVLTHHVLDFLGPSEWSLRIVPALLGAVSPLLLFAWARRLVEEPTAVLASALLAVHPFHIALSQYGRVYSLALATMLLGFLMPHRLGDRRVFAPTALFLGFQPLTHLLSGFAAIPHLVELRFGANVRRRHIVASVLLGLVLLAGTLPFGVADSILSEHAMAGVAHRVEEGPMALQPRQFFATAALSLSTLFGIDVAALPVRTRHVLPVLAVLVALSVAGARSLSGVARLVVGLGALLPLAVTIALCFVYHHLGPLMPRYSVWALPFLLLLMAAGIRRLPAPGLIFGGVVLLYVALDVAASRLPREGFRMQSASAIAACSSEEAPISVQDAVDGFVAGAARPEGAFFRLVEGQTEGGLSLTTSAACSSRGGCPTVPICPTTSSGDF